MGNCVGASDNGGEQSDRSRQIESQLRRDHVKHKTKKLLLLGTGDAGKSTFFRQLQIMSGYSSFGSLAEQRDAIGQNVLHAVLAVLSGSETLGVPFSDENGERVRSLRSVALDTSHAGLCALGADIRQIATDAGFRQVIERGNAANLPTSLPYWLANLDRIIDPDYKPTHDDLLRSRSRTSGITDYTFDYSGKQFSVVDVGGQRSERRKWIHCFDGVDCLIFFTAISEYDRQLEEDSRVNRMHESLRLFREIINSQWFVTVPIVLMLNKYDIFVEKIATRDLRCCFPDYAGPSEAKPAAKYIRKQFLETNKGERSIFPHLTCATDSQQMRVVFAAIVSNALTEALNIGGL